MKRKPPEASEYDLSKERSSREMNTDLIQGKDFIKRS
jgi:hypothetical protein